MSTKNTLFYNDNFHIYTDFSDSCSIYLKLNKSDLTLLLQLKIEDFLKISKCVNLESLEKQANLTDEQIRTYCEKRVEERIDQDSFASLFGFCIFGSNKLPKQEQIENGVSFLIKKRNELKEIKNSLSNINFNNYTFGLENLI